MLRFGLSFFFFFFYFYPAVGQPPFYYKLKRVKGTVSDSKGTVVSVEFKSRRKLLITPDSDTALVNFLRTLTLAKSGRKALEHLLKTRSKVKIEIMEKACLFCKDGKYGLIAGLTGPAEGQSDSLITDYDDAEVYEENTIQLFRGSLRSAWGRFNALDSSSAFIYHFEEGKSITRFIMDTIEVQPLQNPDHLYKTEREFFYLAGVHEIRHTHSENIDLYLAGEDCESDAFEKEYKAFKERQRVNRRRIRE